MARCIVPQQKYRRERVSGAVLLVHQLSREPEALGVVRDDQKAAVAIVTFRDPGRLKPPHEDGNGAMRVAASLPRPTRRAMCLVFFLYCIFRKKEKPQKSCELVQSALFFPNLKC
jgi:hypothetical protein